LYQITLAYDTQIAAIEDLGFGYGYGYLGGSGAIPIGWAREGYDFFTPGIGGATYEFPQVAFKHLPMVETFQSYGNRAWHDWDVNALTFNKDFGASQNYAFHGTRGGVMMHPARGYDLLQRDHAKEDLYGWKGHPTQFFVNPFSNNMCTFTSHMAPGDTTTAHTDAAYTGSMGLGGAGTKTALRTDDCWDTFYCSYVIYNHGQGLFTHEKQTPTTVTVDATLSPHSGHTSVSDLPGYYSGNMINPAKYISDPAKGDDLRYYSLSFPEDFVGTKGDSTTDPFHAVRDYSDPQKRIYGNVNIIFKIPSINSSNAPQDYVHIGSKELERETVYVGGVPIPSAYGTPAPAITFDLSDNEFIFDNNKNITLTIENSGYVMGGGGSGGRGSVTTSFFAETPRQYFGGGGGSGGGSGGFEVGTTATHQGVGIGGSGYGMTVASGLGPSVISQAGQNGGDLLEKLNMNNWKFIVALNPHASYGISPGGGTAASEFNTDLESGDLPFWFNTEPKYGGDGGDAIKIITGSILPVVDIINKTNSGGYDAVFVSGGGGGGGGVGKTVPVGTTSSDNLWQNASGAAGGAPGHHGNAIQGNPSGTFYSGDPELTQEKGGLAGYLVSDSTGGPYQGKVYIRNESTKTIYGRAPSLYEHTNPGTITRNYEAGFSIAQGETKTYQGT
jgi:hypothetical protein